MRATTPDWQSELRSAVRSVDELLEQLKLKRSALPWQPDDHPRFHCMFRRVFVRRMHVGTAREFWRARHAERPGYLFPRLVRETPNEAAKTCMNG